MSQILYVGHLDLSFYVDSTTLDSHQSFFDYEIVLIDPQPFIKSQINLKKLMTYSEYREMRSVIERRANEAMAFIQSGGLVVYMPHEAIPNRHYDNRGDISQSPASDVFVKTIRNSTGRKFTNIAENYSIKKFFLSLEGMISYRVIFESTSDITPALYAPGSQQMVGGYKVSTNGSGIVFSPEFNLTDSNIQTFLEALLSLRQDLSFKEPEVIALPDWHEEYLIPGEGEAKKVIQRIQNELAQIQLELDIAHRNKKELEKWKYMVTSGGATLEAAVKEAFSFLSFKIETGLAGRDDLIGSYEGQAVVIEVKGREKKGAAESDAAQLEKWVSNFFHEHQVHPKGILVVNGYFELPLEAREQEVFPNQMLKYSINREHCLISSLQLLCLCIEAGDDPENKKRAAQELFHTSGVFEGFKGEAWKQVIQKN